VFAVDFLSRMSRQADALPFHVARKKVPCIDDRGRPVTPDKPNTLRFERFIFDLLPAANNALVVEADPADAFAPVKNADDEATDTPTTARAAMVAQARRRLLEAGVKVEEGVTVEINPLWALDANEIRSKLPVGSVIDRPTYFGEGGPKP
jgi:UDP-N-acetylglucosamine/UDP-N-acetylgalactosamine diphosphorylase